MCAAVKCFIINRGGGGGGWGGSQIATYMFNLPLTAIKLVIECVE